MFNDVAVAASNFNGIPGSLPAVIEVGEEYTHSFTFDPSEIKNVSGYLMLAEGMSLHCVAMVIDTAYHNVVVNSVRTGDVGYVSGIDDTVAEPCVVSTEWHDLTGARVADRASGLLLRTVTLSDGTRRTDKVMVR